MKDKTHIMYRDDNSYTELADHIQSHSQFCLLSDTNTNSVCRKLFTDELGIEPDVGIMIQAGEESKDISNAQIIWKRLIESDFDRNSLIVNLGGGMISDLGGYSELQEGNQLH